MTQATFLIVGTPSSLRDQYELAVRRRASDVAVCADIMSAQVWLHDADVQAVLLLVDTASNELDAFLSVVCDRHEQTPVFVVASGETEMLRLSLDRYGVVVLPPHMSPGHLERVLFPAMTEAPNGTPAWRPGAKSVTLDATEYPLHLGHAKALFETEYLTRVLEREGGNVSRTARIVDAARRNLQLKIQAYNIDIARIRHDR